MYAQLFEKLRQLETVAIRLSRAEQKLKDFYPAPKYSQLAFGTDGEVRFWILSDGTIIRVFHDTHSQAVEEANVSYDDLSSDGALRGYSIKESREFGVEGDIELSSAQKTSILHIVMKHRIKSVFVDSHWTDSFWTGSVDDLKYYLEFGEDPNESIDEAKFGLGFGVDEAGWIHSNGKREELVDYNPGDHDVDAFRKIHPGEDVPKTFISSFPKEYTEYLKQGHIRYISSGRGFNIELIVKPTDSQLRAIRKGIKEGTGEFYFSVKRVKGSSYGADGSSWEAFREVLANL